MATSLTNIIATARLTLLESTARFWSDAELLGHANSAIKDLWKGVIDLYKDHIVTMDTTSMSIAANTQAITGVPTDLFRVVNMQPRVVGPNSSNKGLVFQNRELTHKDFVQAKAGSPVAARNNVIYYAIINAGAPVGAPGIVIAPLLTEAVSLEVWYNPVIPTKVAGDDNPIPGESDKAIVHYIIAFARAKEREDRSPDPEHLSIYATEKRNLLTVLTPRSIQEPEVVDSFMGDGTDVVDLYER